MMKSTKKKILNYSFDVVLLVILVLLDQFTKKAAILRLKDKPPFVIWDGVFELQYLENRGAAFGTLQNQKIFFIVMTVVLLLILLYVFAKMPAVKKYGWLEKTLVFMAAGGIGNFIDRLLNGYVVDFFYFKLIDFAIFNVADIYITLSCIVFGILILFYYKENDFAFLKRKKESKD